MPRLAASLALLLLLPLPRLALAAPPAAPRAQVVLALQLTRAEGNGPGQIIGAPVISTFDGSTASIQITGADPEYAISVSPTVEPENRVALLWTLQLSGKSLPGATGASLNGATRVLRDRTDPIAEITLRDPRTGRSSAFRLLVKITVAEPR